jgi:hypothetical protein
MELPINNDASVLTNPQELTPLEENTVKLWRKRLKESKDYFIPDFKRMRNNMEFAAGLQWMGQDDIDDVQNRYQADFMTQHVNRKVASLYAKDPKAVAKRRKRLDYQLWDGNVATEVAANMAMQQGAMLGQVNPQALALLQDITQGRQWEALCDKIGQTLEILYQYQCDTQSPSFKFQMKQLVRRVITCGVGYVRLNYVNENDHVLSSTLTDDSMASRLLRVKGIVNGIDDDKIPSDDPRIEQAMLLVQSIANSIQQGDQTNVEERLEFDFPSATSIIVDKKCKCLKGFIGADWIAQEFILPLDWANNYFELTGEKMITTGGEFIEYMPDKQEKLPVNLDAKPVDVAKEPLGCFWEVFDLTTKTSFFICDGYKYFVQTPAPVEPAMNRFWPIFSLTFNDIEVESGQKVHIYPPSDIQLLKPMQQETNRSGNELIEHRKVNRPFFYGLQGLMDEADCEKLANHETGEFVQIRSALMGANGSQNVVDALGKWVGTPIDPNVYATARTNEDISKVVSTNQIQPGQNIRHTAATPAVIQEQARISDVNSNVDDLDDLLSEMAQGSGELMLRKFNPQTVLRIAGRGAAWPQDNRQDFLNEIFLDIVASSSGRPNKAVDVQNAQTIIPLMLQAGANPLAIITYVCKVLDANLNPADFFPPLVPMMPQGQPQQGQQSPQKPQTPQPQHPGLVGQQQNGQGLMPMQQGGLH